jgi:cyclopropane fatty-acyl-phospholipid synthase-like methyltransferase
MLSRAKAQFPAVQFEKVGLQEISYRDVYDGAICMDAMEHVCPEDWPLVLSNFHQALKQGGYLYLTVEVAEEKAVRQAFNRAQQAGLPVVYGEWPDEAVYHYYPAKQRVKAWIRQAGFELLHEGEGDNYHHFMVRKAAFGQVARA